ncbi:carboxypeptidase regulatory-like domain-containing protein [Methanoregula sp.]|uniref:carboxypeptidase regulatory-like domain-containing protein n=1 Tax=Methanoregula sp. TaxID=2052170 RepID=UPI002608C43F|nr:carboxypeptidase regulatory-like domain-containing protein [Methanoregula sp.]MDD5141933.1 carboxypeptidase regulatory-like domain-containing protein [Methanoregula sp.]
MIPRLVLLLAVIFCIPPVLAENSTISIAYWGSGGYYIGDTIIFDGTSPSGNSTAIRLTGPDLPANGVPIYDLDGAEGTGNPVVVKDDGKWRLVWYTGSIKGVDKMQTARYYITVFDVNNPEVSAKTSVMMKKPDFYVIANPDTLETGEYLQLQGTAEQGTSDIHIIISDEVGKVYRTYDTAASRSGYFTYAFRVDMPPGTYYVTVSSPSVKNTYRTTITVVPPATPVANVTLAPTTPAGMAADAGTLSVSSNPAGAAVSVDSVSMGVTPITLANIAPGTHTVEIRSPGYLTFSLPVTVYAGETTSLSPVLVKSPLSLPVSPVTTLAGVIIAGVVLLVGCAVRKTD